AYLNGNIDFLMKTTLPSSREGSDEAAMRAWAESAEWTGLDIVSTQDGDADSHHGAVEFVANYKLNGIAQRHHEKSVFVKHEGRWYFKDGEVVYSGPAEKPMPIVKGERTGRNDPCSCGSGKKFKKCCGA
ncbi:MAG: YchJ family metal-binding protein, partial [Moraxellaceae bacterium]|nr:YchJ family metal-binding protein [Moraxellaceae bacterium]